MAEYRVYCLDGANHFVRTEPIDAFNDDDAIRMARVVMGDCLKAEIWEGNRMVARLGLQDELG